MEEECRDLDKGGWQEMTVSEANFDGSNINITEVFFQWFLDPKAFAKLIFLY